MAGNGRIIDTNPISYRVMSYALRGTSGSPTVILGKYVRDRYEGRVVGVGNDVMAALRDAIQHATKFTPPTLVISFDQIVRDGDTVYRACASLPGDGQLPTVVKERSDFVQASLEACLDASLNYINNSAQRGRMAVIPSEPILELADDQEIFTLGYGHGV